MQDQQPGQVIVPVASASEPVAVQQDQVQAPALPIVPPLPAAQTAASDVAVTSAAVVATQAPVPNLGEPQVGPPPSNAAPQTENTSELTWTAAEYVHHEKDSAWYGAFTLGAIVLTAAIFFFTKDIISTAVVALAVGSLAFISARKPRQETYTLEREYLHVGAKSYSLQDFKAFTVDEESPILNVTLLPLRRLLPAITVYVDELHEQDVLDYFADFLPSEPHKIDAIDRILRRLHF